MSDVRGMMLLPALNEERQIAAVLRGLAQWANGFEPVVIDDGSVDDTGKVARQAGATVLDAELDAARRSPTWIGRSVGC